jgi:hypothetical protein
MDRNEGSELALSVECTNGLEHTHTQVATLVKHFLSITNFEI